MTNRTRKVRETEGWCEKEQKGEGGQGLYLVHARPSSSPTVRSRIEVGKEGWRKRLLIAWGVMGLT